MANSSSTDPVQKNIKLSPFTWMCLCLGLSLAAHESRQYTALWSFIPKTSEELLIAFICIVITGTALLLHFRVSQRTQKGYWVIFLVLIILQSFGTIGQMLTAYGIINVPGSQLVVTALSETSFFALILLAPIALAIEIKNIAQMFLYGFMVAGCCQMIAALLQPPAAIVLTLLFAPCAAFCLFKGLFASPATPQQKAEPLSHRAPSRASLGKGGKGFGFIALVVALFLMGTLLINTHGIRMAYQDGGVLSQAMQVFGGASSFIAGLLLLILDRRLTSETTISLCCFIALPIILGVLYISSLATSPAGLLPILFLHRVGYALMLYLLWSFPRLIISRGTPEAKYIGGFLASRIGWAFGIVLYMILPQSSLVNTISVILIIALGVVCVFIFTTSLLGQKAASAHCAPTDSQMGALASQSELTDAHPKTPETFDSVCEGLGKKYGLTPREMDVFHLLARGRTALHIQKQLCVSDGTARTHINHIYRKMTINSHQELLDIVEEQFHSR